MRLRGDIAVRVRVNMTAYMDIDVPEGMDLDEYMELTYFGSEKDFMELVQKGNEDTGWDCEWFTNGNVEYFDSL